MHNEYLTLDEWQRMTWRERIASYRSITSVRTTAEVATRLGVSVGAVVGWEIGRNEPNSYTASIMRRSCVLDVNKEKEAMWKTIVSSGFDCGETFYKHALVTGDTYGISIALSIIAAKILHAMQTGKVALDPSQFLFYRDSLYGAWPAWERVTVTPVDTSLRHVTMRIVISHTVGEAAEFTLNPEVHVSGVPQFRSPGAVSDKSIGMTMTRAVNQFSKLLSTLTKTKSYGKRPNRSNRTVHLGKGGDVQRTTHGGEQSVGTSA